jgi:hypothetical protein
MTYRVLELPCIIDAVLAVQIHVEYLYRTSFTNYRYSGRSEIQVQSVLKHDSSITLKSPTRLQVDSTRSTTTILPPSSSQLTKTKQSCPNKLNASVNLQACNTDELRWQMLHLLLFP